MTWHIQSPHTPGEWDLASDSYGKVQHSRKACVFTHTREMGKGERIVTIAHRIENWGDARLIAAAPDLLEACKFSLSVHRSQGLFDLSERIAAEKLEAAIAQAEGREL